MTTAVDLGDLTTGEAGSLVLTPDRRQSTVPWSRPAAGRPRQGRQAGDGVHPGHAARSSSARTVADNSAKGTTLSLIAPETGRQGARSPRRPAAAAAPRRRKTYTVKAGTTLDVEAARPAGPEGHLRTDRRSRCRGRPGLRRPHPSRPPRAASRASPSRPLPDDRGTVAVPDARAGPVGAAEVTAHGRSRPARVTPAGRPQSSPYRGSTVSGVSPSSSATCSTTTSCTSSGPLVPALGADLHRPR